jgi:hypothetical protein
MNFYINYEECPITPQNNRNINNILHKTVNNRHCLNASQSPPSKKYSLIKKN